MNADLVTECQVVLLLPMLPTAAEATFLSRIRADTSGTVSA